MAMQCQKLKTYMETGRVVFLPVQAIHPNPAQTERYIDRLLCTPSEKTRKANVGAFLNNLTQSLQKIQLSGIPAVSERRETDSQIVLTITIPKRIRGTGVSCAPAG